jgi:DNA-binding NarL/FixJ family response regulator
MSPNTISVIVADDHEIFRDGINTLINKQEGIRIVAEASNGEQLVQLTKLHLPDVILADIEMPVMNGIEATRIITQKFPGVGIIALSFSDNIHMIAEMIDAGASGYLLKNALKKEIIEAIRAVSANKSYYCMGTSQKLSNALARNSLNPGDSIKQLRFTKREKDIINLICEELSTQGIAAKLNLGIRTIEGYRARLLQKTGCHNTPGLVVYIMQHNLYKP